ncbi:stabilizer of axonemal microtubules 4 [Clinocottus analis]|uniref:stabilizer of axonemal microtubules 4 n=1 Tax=Clinocottus analis TaxID=304258 RepID=UPI0035BF3B8B
MVRVHGMMTFTPHLGHAAGYTSNQRPAIFYKPSLDLIDNPRFGLLLYDNFMSQTKRHYPPPAQSDHTGPFPNLMNKSRHSGFHQLKSLPKTATVEENTEYQRWFVPHHITASVSQNHSTVGPKGESGFTEGTDLQLNTFVDKKSCMVETLQDQSSVMKSDFLTPPLFLQGTEARPNECGSHFSRETGFTRGAVAPLACPTSLLPSPQTKSNAPTTESIGKKEPSGFLLNAPSNQTLPHTPFGYSHVNTSYESAFCHSANYEMSTSDHTGAGIMNGKRDNSYNRRDMDKFMFRS